MSAATIPPLAERITQPAVRHSCSMDGLCSHTISIGQYVKPLANSVLRVSLVVILGWIGAMKFTAYEAEGIRPFVENSPLFAWTLQLTTMRQVSDTLGLIEVIVALMIAARPISRYTAALGGAFAAGMFLSTLTFLVTTPGTWVSELGGAPAISVLGQFLIKDLGLLGIALWSIAEALTPSANKQPMTGPSCTINPNAVQ
jgi:reactive chlorine resistance protein C